MAAGETALPYVATVTYSRVVLALWVTVTLGSTFRYAVVTNACVGCSSEGCVRGSCDVVLCCVVCY